MPMKINILEDTSCAQTEVTIRCRQADNARVSELAALLHTFDRKLAGKKEEQTIFVDASHVLYFESVDKKTFFYTNNDVLETPLRLYELENRFSGGSFVRVSKSVIVNLVKVASLRPEFGGRIELTLENGERVIASRQYAGELKRKLGL